MLFEFEPTSSVRDRIVGFEALLNGLADGCSQPITRFFEVVRVNKQERDRAMWDDVEGNFFALAYHMDDGLTYLMPDGHFVEGIGVVEAQVCDDEFHLV